MLLSSAAAPSIFLLCMGIVSQQIIGIVPTAHAVIRGSEQNPSTKKTTPRDRPIIFHYQKKSQANQVYPVNKLQDDDNAKAKNALPSTNPCPNESGCDPVNPNSYAYCSYNNQWSWLLGPVNVCSTVSETKTSLADQDTCGCCPEEKNIVAQFLSCLIFPFFGVDISSPSYCENLVALEDDDNAANNMTDDLINNDTENNLTDDLMDDLGETNSVEINVEEFVDETTIPGGIMAEGSPIVEDLNGNSIQIKFNATTIESGIISLSQVPHLISETNCSFFFQNQEQFEHHLNKSETSSNAGVNTNHTSNETTSILKGIATIKLKEGNSFAPDDLEALFSIGSMLVVDGNTFGSCFFGDPTTTLNTNETNIELGNFMFTENGFLQIENVTKGQSNKNDIIEIIGIPRDQNSLFQSRDVVIEIIDDSESKRRGQNKKCERLPKREINIGGDRVKFFVTLETFSTCASSSISKISDRFDLDGMDYTFVFTYSGGFDFKGIFGVKSEDTVFNGAGDDPIVANMVDFLVYGIQTDIFAGLLPEFQYGLFAFVDIVAEVKVVGSFSLMLTGFANLDSNDIMMSTTADWSDSLVPNFNAIKTGPDIRYGSELAPDISETFDVNGEAKLTLAGFFGFKMGIGTQKDAKNKRTVAVYFQLGEFLDASVKVPPFDPVQPSPFDLPLQTDLCFEEHDVEIKADLGLKPLTGEISLKIDSDWWPFDPVDFNPKIELTPTLTATLLLWCLNFPDEECENLCSNGECLPPEQCPCDPCTADCCEGGQCCDASTCIKPPQCCPGQIRCDNQCVDDTNNGCCPGFKSCKEGPEKCISENQCCPEEPFSCPNEPSSCYGLSPPHCCKKCNNGQCQQYAGMPPVFKCCPEDGEEVCGCCCKDSDPTCGGCKKEGSICCSGFFELPEQCACGNVNGELCINPDQYCCNAKCISKNDCCPDPTTGCCPDEIPCENGCVPKGTCCPEKPQLCNGKCIAENECCEFCPDGVTCKKEGECCPPLQGSAKSSKCGCFEPDKICCSDGKTYAKSQGCPCELIGGTYCPPPSKCCSKNGIGSCIGSEDCCEPTDGKTCDDGSCEKNGSNEECCPEDSCSNDGPCCPTGKKCCEKTCIENDKCCPACVAPLKCCDGSCIGEDDCCESSDGSSCDDGSCANDEGNDGCCEESQCGDTCCGNGAQCCDGSCKSPECCGSDDPCCGNDDPCCGNDDPCCKDSNSCACASSADCDDSGGSGDPHMTTFDGLQYDCQGGGDFILARSLDSPLMIQGRFTKLGRVSVTTGVAASMGPDTPTISIFVNSTSDDTQIFVNGTSYDLATGYKDTEAEITSIDYRTIRLYYRASGVAVFIDNSTWRGGGYFNVRLRTPSSYRKERIVGLLGSPDDNSRNDWMNANGETLLIPGSYTNLRGLLANAYCTTHWCIRDIHNSLFPYRNLLEFKEVSRCDDEPHGAIDLSGVSFDILEVCGNDFSCLIDGLTFGKDAAMDTVAAQERLFGKSSRFRFTPNRLIVGLSTSVNVTVDFPKADIVNFVDEISSFILYEVDPETGERSDKPLAALMDTGSGIGDDIIPDDDVYSTTISLQATSPGQFFGFEVVPLINGVINSNFFMESRTAVRSFLYYGEKAPCISSYNEIQSALEQWQDDSTPDGTISLTYGWPIGSWCFAESVDSFWRLFYWKTAFNNDIYAWDTSHVASFTETFHHARAFTGTGIAAWNTSSATSMQSMFYVAQSFNEDISSWVVDNVTSMSWMFFNAESFNQDLSSWNIGQVTSMSNMFGQAISFNQDLCAWGPMLQGRSVSVGSMFSGALCFNNGSPNLNFDIPTPLCFDCA